MEQVEVTTLSSKGQVVIPQGLREAFALEEGIKFAVYGDANTIILKRLSPPSSSEMKVLLAKTRRLAKKSGIKRSDLAKAVQAVRKSP
jgi:AbrB family looped-hinge helix DNA binding protein